MKDSKVYRDFLIEMLDSFLHQKEMTEKMIEKNLCEDDDKELDNVLKLYLNHLDEQYKIINDLADVVEKTFYGELSQDILKHIQKRKLT